MSIALAAVGDATDPATWSGTPWHFLETAGAFGMTARGLKLDAKATMWRRRRVGFSITRLVAHGEMGGYQYSDAFLKRLFGQDPLRAGECVVNMFQLYPRDLFERHDGQKWFYIDQTLSQLFENYGVGARVGRKLAANSIVRERAQYQAAAGVIGQSKYAADDLVACYGVPKDRVHVVVAGANLPRAALDRFERFGQRAESDRPLKLVFVGKDPVRKGLDRLIEGLKWARSAGGQANLLAIGIDPKEVPSALKLDGVDFVGSVDKKTDTDRFIDLVASCDVGCLLSRAEAGGISLREFHRLGLPTIAPRVGGAPEYVLQGASFLVPPDAGPDEIGSIIHRLATQPELLAEQRRIAWKMRHEASWDIAMQKIAKIIGAG